MQAEYGVLHACLEHHGEEKHRLQGILHQIDNRVATITLNRLETLNASINVMLDEWTDALVIH
jgi:hypothetical protein